MAILRGSARLILEEHRRRPFYGSALELGKFIVFLGLPELERWAREQGAELTPLSEPARSHISGLAERGCMDDVTFFRSLGFDRVTSCDISDYEGADRILDLNRTLPEDLEGQFDAIFDSGTLQHIFHLPNALRNMHRALRVGGRMIFAHAPSHNHVDHGFYMFSPTLFADYFAANRYQIEVQRLFTFKPYWLDARMYTTPWKVYRYEPGSLDHLSYGGFGGQQVALFFVATKTEESTGDVVPQQRYYRELWPVSDGAPSRGESSGSWKDGLEAAWVRLARGRSSLLWLGGACKRFVARLRRRPWPPFVGRY